jgi:hypothetical protein
MSTLFEQIKSDLKKAMLAKDAAATSALRMMKSAIMNAAIAQKVESLSDDDVVKTISKQLKQSQDSKDQYKSGGREDLVKKEESDIAVFERYLPKQISEEDLTKIVQEVLSSNNITSKKDFGKAIKLTQDAVKGKADNKRISQALEKSLN